MTQAIIVHFSDFLEAIKPPTMKRAPRGAAAFIPKVTSIDATTRNTVIIRSPSHDTIIQCEGALPVAFKVDAHGFYGLLKKLPKITTMQLEIEDNSVVLTASALKIKYNITI